MDLSKKSFLAIFTLLFFYSETLLSETYRHLLSDSEKGENTIVWEETDTLSFDELILCWNAPRTENGDYAFFVSLRQNGEWSPFLYYGDWGVRGQMLTGESASFAKTGRGSATATKGQCDGFRIEVASPNNLLEMERLWVSTAHLAAFKPPLSPPPALEPILLENVPRQSTYTLRLPRYWDMTMVAAMLSAIGHLGKTNVDIEDFASRIMDGDFECYDFWPLHAAEAYHRLAGAYQVHVERLPDFSALHSCLLKGTPVLVDIQGTPQNGLMWPHYRSHILLVIGYDPLNRKVHCLDPIFPGDKSTSIAYGVDDFIRLWAKRQNIACIFTH